MDIHVKLLHTSDWHVGKTLKGRNRLEEHKAVLAEIVKIAVDNDVDAVLVAGDLYETSAPTADAQALMVRTLMRLARQGIEVVVIAGNHDHGATLEAYKPLMAEVGIHIYGQVRAAENGGVYRFTARSTGEEAVIAVLPFLSQRYAVKAAELIANTPAQNVGTYDQMVRDVLDNLTGAFTDATVNVVMAHLTCINGTFGGGERAAQSIFEYAVPAGIFPSTAHYVALGHLHRRQSLPAACPVHYSGAPFPVDFGEQDNTHVVCLVEVSPTTPAKVTDIPITSGRRLRTVEGTVAQLVANADEYGDDFLRVWVRQATYAGLRDDVMAALPNALEIRIHEDFASNPHASTPTSTGSVKTPAELFATYCDFIQLDDKRVSKLFDEIHDDLTSSNART